MNKSMSIKLTVAQIRDLADHTAYLNGDTEVTVASAMSLHALHLPDGIYARVKGKDELYGPLALEGK